MQMNVLAIGFLFLNFILQGSLLTAAQKVNEKLGQKSKSEDNQAFTFTFRVPVDVVVVNATVTDKSGKPVKDLKAEDFKIFEDGKPQTIHTFALETYRAVQEPARSPAREQPSEKGETTTQSTSPRFFCLAIDDLNSPVMDQFYRSIEAMKQFINDQILPGDLAMIYAISGRAELPFTSEKQSLLQYLSGLYKKLNLAGSNIGACPPMTDLQAYRIVMGINDSISLPVAMSDYCNCGVCPNENLKEQVLSAARQQYEAGRHYRRVALASLRQLAQSIRHFEGKKSVILFSPGFLGEDVHYEIQELVDRSLRSGVVFNAIDVRGLYTVGFEASDRVGGADGTLLGQKLSLLGSSKSMQADPLEQIALDTGGIFFHNNNDLYAGMKQVVERESYSYVLTYASSNVHSVGRYHKIKLEGSRPGLEVSYRKGYYEPKEEISYESRRKEDIQEAMWAPGNVNQIPIQISHEFYQLEDHRYQLSLTTRVDLRRVKFQLEEERHKNLVNLVVMVLDEKGQYIDGVQKNVEFILTDASYGQLLNYGMTLKLEIAVPPGRYQVKSVVREGVQTKMGSLTKMVEVP